MNVEKHMACHIVDPLEVYTKLHKLVIRVRNPKALHGPTVRREMKSLMLNIKVP